MDRTYKNFKQAWSDDDLLVYPPSTKDSGERWFLRTPVNMEQTEELVLIGMNPSKATALQQGNRDGDRTTGALLTHFPLDDQNRPIDYRRITIVNLIPLVSGSGDNLPVWKESEGHLEILESVGVTCSVLPSVLSSADIVLPMWGDPEADNYPWKKHVLPIIKLLIKECRNFKDFKIQGFTQPTKKYPYHCGYSEHISRWSKNAWTDDASFVLQD